MDLVVIVALAVGFSTIVGALLGLTFKNINEKWNDIISQVGKIPHSELRKRKDDFIKIRKFGIHGLKNKEQTNGTKEKKDIGVN
jgi:hypothetical protein